MNADWQFQLGDVLFGLGTQTHVDDFTWDTDDDDTHERAAAADGIRFGRDYEGATTYSLSGALDSPTLSPTEVLSWERSMKAAFRADNVRFTPGAVTALRMRRPGTSDMRVFGRPGKFKVTSREDLGVGWLPWTAEFAAADSLFYEDTEQSDVVGIAAAAQGAWTVPATVPWGSTTPGAPTFRTITVAGNEPTPCLRVAITGPVTNPTVQFVDQWSFTLTGTLAADQTVTVDARPWARSVVDNFGRNWAGKFTAGSRRLVDMALPPGQITVLFRGTDTTGTASMRPYWRGAWASY